MSLFHELKRRNVFRAGAAYAVVAWLLIQVAETVFPLFGYSDTPARIVVIVLAIGFPVTLLLAWVFELTPEGLKTEKELEDAERIPRSSGRTLDRVIIVVLALALGYFALDKFVLDPARDAEPVANKAAGGQAASNSIAVLPFVNMSNDAGNEYFSDGVSEELLNLLAQIPELRVISRSSAFSFKGKDVLIPEVARQLNVAHVLSGSIRKSGDKVRITAQLVDAAADSPIWSETYDRTLTDVFAIQDDIAADVVANLSVALLGGLPRSQQTDVEAYTVFLEARHLARQGTKEGFESAIQHYQQVLEIDPTAARAWTGMALVYINLSRRDLLPWDEGHALARDATEKALAIDPGFAGAYNSLGLVELDMGNLREAARHFMRSLEIEPTNLGTISNASGVAANLGRVELMVALDEYYVSRDPLNPTGHNNLGVSYTSAGRFDDAIASLRTTLSLSPGYLGAEAALGKALLLRGYSQAAHEAFEREAIEGFRMLGVVMSLHALGKTTASDEALAAMIDEHGEHWAYNIAYALAFRREPDRAFEWLDKAVEHADPGLNEIPTEPLFANLHDDSRWAPFLEKIGKSPEALGAIEFDVRLPD